MPICELVAQFLVDRRVLDATSQWRACRAGEPVQAPPTSPVGIYTAEDCPRLVATIRAVDHGSVDELLRAYGWHRVEAWQRSDDVPDNHRVATVERIKSAIDVLDRDEVDERERRGTSDG